MVPNLKRPLALGAALLVTACAPTTSNQQPATDAIPARAERAIETLLDGFDRDAAMGHVEFMSRYWRLAGNDGFDQSLDRIYERLIEGGFTMDGRTRGGADGPPVAPARIHSYPNQGHGWDHTVGTLAQGAVTTAVSVVRHPAADRPGRGAT